MIVNDNRNRICFQCGEPIVKEQEYYKHSTKLYHKECLYTRLKNKGKSEEEINTIIENKKRKEINEQTKKALNTKDKDNLYTWMYDYYNVVTLPKFFFIKLANIVNGTDSKYKTGISYSELYEMYQLMGSKLDKIANSKRIGNSSRYFWDLAIVMSDVPKYRSWKQKQEVENKPVNNNDLLKFKKIKQTKVENNIKNDDNINDLIF